MIGKQLAQSAPSASGTDASILQCKTGQELLVTKILVANSTALAATFRIYHDVDGTTYSAATALYFDVSVAANTTTAIPGPIYLSNPSGNLAVRVGTANALTFTVYGIERSLGTVSPS